MIFNASLETGIFPDMWKLVYITQIYKSSQKSDLSNYRPISVLSVLSRLLEKLAHDQLYNFCGKNDFYFYKITSQSLAALMQRGLSKTQKEIKVIITKSKKNYITKLQANQ